MEDEDLNVANEDAADNAAADADAADAYAGLGGLSAMNLTKPEDISRAILASSQAQQRYYDDLAKQIKERRYGPSGTEKLLALSSAFFAPTSVRGFSGTMGNVLPVLQKFGELKRTGEEERTEALQNLAKQRMALAQGDVKNVIALQNLQSRYGPQPLVLPPGSVVVDKRDPNKVLTRVPGAEETVVTIGGRQFIKGPKGLQPLTTEANWRPATPEEAAMYGATAGQIDDTTGEFKPAAAAPERKLTSTEQKMMFENADVISASEDTLNRLQKVMELSPTAFEGSLSGIRKGIGSLFNSDDPAYLAAQEMDTLIKEIAIGKLKTTFPGAITNAEREFLVQLQGSSSLPRAARERLWSNAIPMLQRIIERAKDREEKIRSGYYSGASSSTPKTIRYDKQGNRIK